MMQMMMTGRNFVHPKHRRSDGVSDWLGMQKRPLTRVRTETERQGYFWSWLASTLFKALCKKLWTRSAGVRVGFIGKFGVSNRLSSRSSAEFIGLLSVLALQR